jgi:hypothetical protein
MGVGQLFEGGKKQREEEKAAGNRGHCRLPRGILRQARILVLATAAPPLRRAVDAVAGHKPPRRAMDTSPALLPPLTGMNATADHSCV